MYYTFILRNATVITPTLLLTADLGISGEKITKIGKIPETAALERDCAGLFILPGLIDMHVHLRDPGLLEKEDFSTGTQAAAKGGVTTVIDMPNTNPPTVTSQALEEKRKIAEKKSFVNYGFFFGFTGHNEKEIKLAPNIAGVKVYLGSTTGNLFLKDPHLIEKLFTLGKFIIVHAEDEHIIRERAEHFKDLEDPCVHSLIRMPLAAYEATKTILHLAKKHGAQVHITHVSTSEEVNELRKFKNTRVSADLTPHHLYLTKAAYAERGNFVKVNPPLRTKKDRKALWQGLKDGTIQAIASDHAPHTKVEKEQKYSLAPAGAPGLETMLPLLLDSVNHGELMLREVAKLTSENPARLLRIKGKGRIEAGFDADLVVVDMNKEMEVGSQGFFTKCNWSPFSGWKLKGWPVMTTINGKIVFEDGKITAAPEGKGITFL